MFGMGHIEILIIFLIILLIFGAKRIPEMAQGLGKGIREFRTAMRDVQEEIDINAPTSNSAQNDNLKTTPATESVAQSTPNNIGSSSAQQSAEKGADNKA